MSKIRNKDLSIRRSRPLIPLDIEDCDDFPKLLELMSRTSFGARQVGRAWSVLKEVSRDHECSVVLTVSGAMTVAKLGPVFGALIARGIVKAVVTTGAVVTHALVEEMGLKHYEAPHGVSDDELADLGLNRVYDSLEPEANLETLERHVRLLLKRRTQSWRFGSFEFVRDISAEISNRGHEKGLLCSALKQSVDIFVPTLTDSELGLFLYRHISGRKKDTLTLYDPFIDLTRYASWMRAQRKIAFLTLGGGVPRNWAQQMLPFLKSSQKSNNRSKLPKVSAAIRICPDPPSFGHLSGSTYSEGVTWGKFEQVNERRFIEINADATIVFPILAKAVIQHFDSQSKTPR